jgi:hypothetical protein
VEEAQRYSASEMERMMKVQDVLLKAMAKKFKVDPIVKTIFCPQ